MVVLKNISKYYRKRNETVKALDEINLYVKKGEFIVVQGHSGSGKTTLLLTIGGMLHPTSGLIEVNENSIYDLTEKERAQFRAKNVGFVFQMFHLLPYLNVIENVLLPTVVDNGKNEKVEAENLLNRFGLTDRLHHKPYELSTGERQRVAMARALVNKPALILADEPTGNLDPDNAADIMSHLAGFHREGCTVIVVTHGEFANQYADRIIHLNRGILTD